MSQCGGWRPIMSEEHGFFKRAWYIILIIALSSFYFCYAIFGGIYEWAKKKFMK